MPSLRRTTFLLLAVLSIPIFPLLLLGLAFEQRVEDWVTAPNVPPAGRFALVVAALAADVLLPVPASAISTWAGGVLGLWRGTLASTVGMTLGATIGFGLARAFGRGVARRLSGERDLEQTAELADRYGPLAVIVTRPLPILAEACVLLLGTTRLSWPRFLVAAVASNLAVSFVYAACGRYFRDHDALPAAVIASGTVPLLAALAVRRWWRRRRLRGKPDDGDKQADLVPTR